MNDIYHHGILGQRWGVRRFENYDGSLTSAGKARYNRSTYNEELRDTFGHRVRFKNSELLPEERVRARELDRNNREIDLPLGVKRERLIESFDENLTSDEKQYAIVENDYGDYRFKAINKGHNDYKFIGCKKIPGIRSTPDSVVDDVLREMFGNNWRSDLNEYYETQRTR